MRKLLLSMLWLLAISCLLGCPHPQPAPSIISGNTVVNCTWPPEPIPTFTADKATVAQLINDLLEDKNNFIDYVMKVKLTRKCYEDSLK